MLHLLLVFNANWGKLAELLVVKSPDIMPGSRTFGKIFSIRMLLGVVIVVGCKIKSMNEPEARESKTPLVWLWSM